MRGRLHHPFFAEIVQLSAIRTREDADGPGPALASGYDDDFDEVIVLTDAGGERVSGRDEESPVFLPCNVEVTSFQALSQLASGNAPDSKIQLVFHRKDLEEQRLIDCDTGECLVRVNDRLVSLRDDCRRVVQVIRTPPGLYVTEVQPTFGIGRTPDLLLMSFQDRKQGVSV